MAANYPWPDPNLQQQQGFSLPVSIGPMSLPVEKPKRRWRGLVAWSLCLFAVGVASGPLLTEYAYQAIEAGGAFMAVNSPAFLRPYLPLPVDPNAPPVVAPRSRPGTPSVEAAKLPSEPARAASEPTRPAPAPAPAPEAERAAPERVAAAEPAAHAAKGKHAKSASNRAPAEPAPAPAPSVPTARKASKSQDPFDTGARAAEPSPAKAKATPEPVARPSKSSDGLDSLMAGGVSDEGAKGKAKRSTSKDIDAMLKDVQKSDPAPVAPKRTEQPADLPQLTSSDIARVMGGVKTRANACGKRLNQKGVAELKLTVAKDGRITDVTVGGKVAGTPLAECVDKAARTATFQPNAGLKFDYRIDVR